ncbi:MAG: glycosyltransferase family 1 protein [Pseudomonadaceae bacterium]|nr:MAG: glycosyltransferase family 1 protein [Pseudomonadaceae bacterium]
MKTPAHLTAFSRLPARPERSLPLAKAAWLTQRRHIVIVSETFAPEVNGVAHTLLQLCRGLLAQGYRVSLIRPLQAADKQTPTHAVDQGWCHDQLLVPGMPLPGYHSLHFGIARSSRLRRWLAEQPVDAVYVATQGPLGLAAVRAAKALHIRVCSGFHTNFHNYTHYYRVGFLDAWLRRYCRWFHNQTALTLVPSRQSAVQLDAMGIGPCALWSRGVDCQAFDPGHRDSGLRAEWGVAAETPVLLYVGRLAAEKNLPLALRSYTALKRRYPDARLVLVGDGPLRSELTRNYPDVIFAGVQRGQALARYYASADIFLFPSLTDTFGNVVLEAMASGLTVVAYDMAAAREHLRQAQNGLTLPAGDEQGFVMAVERLCREPQLCQRLRQQARRDALTLGWSQQIRRFAQLLLNSSQEVSRHGDKSRDTLVRTG